MNLHLCCSCGAAWWIIAEGEWALALVADWARQHGAVAGPGHAPCSAGEARRARLRQPAAMAAGGRVTETARERLERRPAGLPTLAALWREQQLAQLDAFDAAMRRLYEQGEARAREKVRDGVAAGSEGHAAATGGAVS